MADSIVLHRAFYSHALGKDKRYCIYLPPSYRERSDLRYSSLYLLPGLMDYERSWVDKGRVHEQMDLLLRQGRVREMLIVMPDKDTAATEEGGEAAFDQYLAQEVIRHIDTSFRTIPSRAHRGLEGLSLGAGWTWHMALVHPDLFCSYGMLSGGFDDESVPDFLKVRDYLQSTGTRFRVGAGLQEPEYIAPNQKLVAFLRRQGLFAELDLADGPHDWPLWHKQIYNSLQFHSYSFNPRG